MEVLALPWTWGSALMEVLALPWAWGPALMEVLTLAWTWVSALECRWESSRERESRWGWASAWRSVTAPG